jgi:secreted trypsin-like serine protease
MVFTLFLLFFSINLIFAEDICGKVSIQSGLVVNGEEARPGEFPFLAALYKIADDKFFCAGNLITRRHVLTGEKEKIIKYRF